MATYKYNFIQVDIDQVTSVDSYSAVDGELINTFEINSSFDQKKNYAELHYYSLDGGLLESVQFYSNFRSAQDSNIANQQTLDSLTLRLEDDIISRGYDAGDVYLFYNFLNDPFSDNFEKSEFFIEEIAPDRFEVRLLSRNLSNESVQKYADKLKEKLKSSTSSDFKLNLGENRFLLATNIDTLEYKDFTSVVIRLYNQLPEDIGLKQRLSIAEEVSDSVAFSINTEIIPDEITIPYLKGPNFNAEENLISNSPTAYLSIQELFSYPVTNSYYEVTSLFNEKGAEISIDHSDYSEFIHFSSAQERLANFQYKLELINTYQSQSNARSAASQSLAGYSGSREYYNELINGVINNFDHYDRFLYFESSSFSWPKDTSTKPYILNTGSLSTQWYATQSLSASIFDSQNPHQLLYSIPEFLREDPNNSKYSIFINMIGQHFDNLWVYTKNVSDKYDSDNRLNYGISKDLIQDALQNFGIKLYNSNQSTQELFKIFSGESFNTGSESYVDEIISGSTEVLSEENYRKQIYKRLYHNLPYLLKSKGTERGLRALLSTFGIPSLYSSGSFPGVTVNQIGGTVSGSFNLGLENYTTSSLGKIRIDNTGSIIPSGSYTSGNVLSRYTSIQKEDTKYSQDLNIVEVGYSPATYINAHIISSSAANNFDIDSILGDPRLAYSSSYDDLISTAQTYLAVPISTANANTGSFYNLKDFTRILKFYDNVLFKTIKDFVPARTNLSTGIIIKPHLLERSKVKQTQLSSNDFVNLPGTVDVADTGSFSLVKKQFIGDITLTGSISIEQTTGSNGSTFGGQDQYSASYSAQVMTSGGLATYDYHNHEEAKFDGEFSGSKITLTTGELNDENTYKYESATIINLKYNFINADADCDITWGEYVPDAPFPTPSTTPGASVTPSPSSITPTPSVTPSNTGTPGATVTPSPSITPSPSYVQQWADFYIDSTAYSNEQDACDNASLGTHVFFTSSIGTSFSDLITAVQGGTPVDIFTDSDLTAAFTSTTQWHGADSTGPAATYALLVNSSGAVGAAQLCSALVPTPTPSPVRQFLQLRNDGSNNPAVGWDTSTEACNDPVQSIVPNNYVNPDDFQTPLTVNTVVYSTTTGDNRFDGGDKYWMSEDGTYAYRIGANGVVGQVIACVAATPTPTPSPSSVYTSWLSERSDGLGGYVGPYSQLYNEGDEVLTEDGSGLCWTLGTPVAVTATQTISAPCPGPSPSPQPTSTASATPCTEFSMQTTGSSGSGIACNQGTGTLRAHDGAGATPTLGDTIYGKNCTSVFAGGNLWYNVGDGVVVQVNNSGLVIDELGC